MRKRKDIINKFRKNPNEKLKSVTEVIEELVLNPELKEWGIDVNQGPHEFETRILQKPYLISGSKEKIEIVDKSSFTR